MSRFYDWGATFSRQTGTNGERCIVIGAKGIGKTFGLRLACVKDYIKNGARFCELCRTNEELKAVKQGYFDRLQSQGFFKDRIFKTEGQAGYVAKILNKDEGGKVEHTPWEVCCYFVSLTSFQREKKRTYDGVKRFIYDEALIDRKDRYHRYLPNEYLILANILDTVSREQAESDRHYKVYLLGNACDLASPYLRYSGITKVPDYGYHYYQDKTVLLHYVEPWDAEERKRGTLVGRMLAGLDESKMMFDNEFSDSGEGDVVRKPKGSKPLVTLRYSSQNFGVWISYTEGLLFVSLKPAGDAPVVALTKKDSSIDYLTVQKQSPTLKMLLDSFYNGLLRYDKPMTRELFFSVLGFLGVQ